MAQAKVYLTKKQRAVLDYIEQYAVEHGEAPTLRATARHFGVTPVSILQHLRALEKKKVVRRAKYARTIEVKPDLVVRGRLPRFEIPCVGSIRAGAPLEPATPPLPVNLANLLETRKECVLLKVVGDSMVDDHIREGDMMIIERREWARDGEIVVAVLPTGEALLKRWFREPDGVRLQSASSSQPPIKVAQAKVYGVAVGLLRKWTK